MSRGRDGLGPKCPVTYLSHTIRKILLLHWRIRFHVHSFVSNDAVFGDSADASLAFSYSEHISKFFFFCFSFLFFFFFVCLFDCLFTARTLTTRLPALVRTCS